MRDYKRGKKIGTRTQKMMSFRADEDVIGWLDGMDNKGRYINELIRADMMSTEAYT